MSDEPRCEYEWNPGVWPYVTRCRTTGELHDVTELLDGTSRKVCAEHRASKRYGRVGPRIDPPDENAITRQLRLRQRTQEGRKRPL